MGDRASHAETWVGGSFGNWTDAADWSGGYVPGRRSDAVIAGSGGGQAVVGISSGERSAVDTLTLSTGGTLKLQGALAVAGAVAIGNGGDLDLAGGTISGGTIAISQAGAFSVSSGMLSHLAVDGNWSLEGTVVLLHDTFGGVGGSGQGTLSSAFSADILVGGGTQTIDNLLITGCDIDIGGGGPSDKANALIIGPGATIEAAVLNIHEAHGTFINDGIIVFDGSGVPSSTLSAVDFVNRGTLQVDGGNTLIHGTNIDNAGVIDVADGATLTLYSTFTGAGIIALGQSITNNGGTVVYDGAISGGTLTGAYSLGGSLRDITIDGALDVANTLTVGAGVDLGNGSAFDISLSNGTLDFARSASLDNSVITVTDGEEASSVSPLAMIEAGTTLTLAASTSISIINYGGLALLGDVVNNGTISLSAPPSIAFLSNVLEVDIGSFTNAGTILVGAQPSGSLTDMPDLVLWEGTATAAQAQAFADHTSAGGLIELLGTITGGALDMNLGFDSTEGAAPGNLDNVAFTGSLTGGSVVLDGTTTLNGTDGAACQVNGVSLITADGTISGDAIELVNSSVVGTPGNAVSLVFAKGTNIFADGGSNSIEGATLENDGNISVESGSLDLNVSGTLISSGAISVNAGSSLLIDAGDYTTALVDGINNDGGTIGLSGTITAGTLTQNISTGLFGYGAVDIAGGGKLVNSAATTLSVGGTVTGGAGSELVNLGTLQLSTTSPFGTSLGNIDPMLINRGTAVDGVLSDVVNSGMIDNATAIGSIANTGTLMFSGSATAGSVAGMIGSVSGYGTIMLAGEASVRIETPSAGQSIAFSNSDNGVTLGSDDIGRISGWAAGDDVTLILSGSESATSFTFSNGLLSLLSGSSVIGSLHFAGSLSASDFVLASGAGYAVLTHS